MSKVVDKKSLMAIFGGEKKLRQGIPTKHRSYSVTVQHSTGKEELVHCYEKWYNNNNVPLVLLVKIFYPCRHCSKSV